MTKCKEYFVIGVGACIGGVRSLKQFIAAMSYSPGQAIIIYQPFSPDYAELIQQLSAQNNKLVFRHAVEDQNVEPGYVYIIPPKRNMIVVDGKFRIVANSILSQSGSPINNLFKSIAKFKKERSIGILLSGISSDGTNGIEAIKSSGGQVIIELSDSESYNGVLSNALKSGVVDHVLPAIEIANRLSVVTSLRSSCYEDF